MYMYTLECYMYNIPVFEFIFDNGANRSDK